MCVCLLRKTMLFFVFKRRNCKSRCVISVTDNSPGENSILMRTFFLLMRWFKDSLPLFYTSLIVLTIWILKPSKVKMDNHSPSESKFLRFAARVFFSFCEGYSIRIARRIKTRIHEIIIFFFVVNTMKIGHPL